MSSKFIQRGGVWVVCQGVLLLAIFSLGICFRGTWNVLPCVIIGTVFLLLSALCGIAGAMALGRNLTPFPRPVQSSRVIQHGIYGLMRHPLYTAVFCGSLGWALVWRSKTALLAALILGPFFAAKARREERWLRETHLDYAAYEQRVKRFIPWLY